MKSYLLETIRIFIKSQALEEKLLNFYSKADREEIEEWLEHGDD